MLSGGLDSSLITAISKKYKDNERSSWINQNFSPLVGLSFNLDRNIFAVSFYGPIVMAIMFISPGLDIDYSKMEQVQNVKASVGLIRPSSPSTERPSKRKASSSIISNSSSRIGASAFTSLHSSQTPGRLCLCTLG